MGFKPVKLLAWPLISLIKLYQFVISPLLPRTCRFFPTCSSYAVEALLKYGVFKGFVLAVRRVLRCHPGHPGGYDPIS